MMKINILLEESPHLERLPEFLSICNSKNITCKTCKNFTLSNKWESLYKDDEDVLFLGTLGLARRILRNKPWNPGAYCDLNNLKVSTYSAHYGQYMFNRGIFLPLGNIRPNKDLLEGTFGKNIFIRPDSGMKEFSGIVTHINLCQIDFRYLEQQVNPHTLCYISKAKRPYKEYRLFIKNNKVITGCQYMLSGEIVKSPITPDIIRYSEDMIRLVGWIPEEYFVMDIHEDQFGDNTIMELNSFSCSGWYDIDLNLLIEAIVEEIGWVE